MSVFLRIPAGAPRAQRGVVCSVTGALSLNVPAERNVHLTLTEWTISVVAISNNVLIDANPGVLFMTRYGRELRRYLTRRLRNHHDADDVAQEVYIRLLKKDKARDVRKPLAYLYGIAAHVLADFWSATRSDRLNVESEPVEEWSEDPQVALPDDLAERLNLQQQVEQALEQLPPTHAAVLLLHKGDGLSYEEVARELNLSIHTVAKYVTQAKSRIRQMPWER